MTKKEVERIVVAIEVDGQTQKRDLTEDLKIDEEHINDHLIRMPAITAWWHRMYEVSRTRVQQKKLEIERHGAELDKNIREELTLENNHVSDSDKIKVTDTRVSNLIKLDRAYQKLEDELLELQETYNFLKAATEAIKEARSTLISLSANMRTEYNMGSRSRKTVEPESSSRNNKESVTNLASRYKKMVNGS